MKLYVNKDKTKWAGTQADAKKEFGMIESYEVPTDKAGLITFLNKVNYVTTTIEATPLPVRNEIIMAQNDLAPVNMGLSFNNSYSHSLSKGWRFT